MKKNQIKNMLVLKNLPSNLIEEAFVVVKDNATVKSLEYIDKKELTKRNENKKNSKDYILREAENVISSYINLAEKENEEKCKNQKNKKYKITKIYSIFITIALIISLCV